jgi:hypothetical protein
MLPGKSECTFRNTTTLSDRMDSLNHQGVK